MDIWSAIILSLVLVCTFLPGRGLLYVTLIYQSFGAMAAIPPTWVGGVTLTPGWIAIAFLGFQTFVLRRQNGRTLDLALNPNLAGLLTLCVLYSLVSAAFFPKLFAGDFSVISMRQALGKFEVPLAPATSNITQSVYMLLTLLLVLTIARIAEEEGGLDAVFKAVLFGGAFAVFTGVLDFAAAAAGQGALLAPLRTGTYALMDNVEIGSMRRVIGLTPEASAYAALCSIFLAFSLFYRNHRSFRKLYKTNLFLSLALAIALIAATSSSGYVALFVIAAFLVAQVSSDMILRGRTDAFSVVLIGMAVMFAAMAMIFYPAAFEVPMSYVDKLIFQKQGSSSYVERSYWAEMAYSAARQSFGLGAGLGSVRASGWIPAMLGNIGVIGTGLMVLFIGRMLFRRSPNIRYEELRRPAVYAMLPILFVGILSGTSVYFNFIAAVVFGVLIAHGRGARPAPVAAPVQNPR